MQVAVLSILWKSFFKIKILIFPKIEENEIVKYLKNNKSFLNDLREKSIINIRRIEIFFKKTYQRIL